MFQILYKLFPFGVERLQAEKDNLPDAIRLANYLLTIGAATVNVVNSKKEVVYQKVKSQ